MIKSKPILHLCEAGLTGYEEARTLQEIHRDRLLEGNGDDVLFLLQHPPTITLGSMARESDLLVPEEELQSRGITVIRTNRGGQITYHGPGQLVGYPVIDLRQLAARQEGFPIEEGGFSTWKSGPSVRKYLRGLEECLVRVLAHLGLKGERVEGATGVWIGKRKIASIGVAVRRWVTTHGFAVNVDMDLAPFHTIRPCGFDASIMTSVVQEGGRLLSWPDLQSLVAEEFAGVMGFRLER